LLKVLNVIGLYVLNLLMLYHDDCVDENIY